MKKVLSIIAVLGLVALLAGVYMYNKPHKDMDRAKADVSITAPQLFSAFENDEEAANKIYLDKVIKVQGTIQNVEKDEENQLSLMLSSGNEMFGIRCQMDELSDQSKHQFKAGDTVTLKGICTGMLMDVVLVRCVKV